MALELVAPSLEQLPTRREREVIALLMTEALHNDEIAERLVVSTSTVKWHMVQIMRKLRVPSRTALVAHAWQNGVVVHGEWRPFAS